MAQAQERLWQGCKEHGGAVACSWEGACTERALQAVACTRALELLPHQVHEHSNIGGAVQKSNHSWLPSHPIPSHPIPSHPIPAHPPGQMALQVMPVWASSSATVLVNPAMPCLAASKAGGSKACNMQHCRTTPS